MPKTPSSRVPDGPILPFRFASLPKDPSIPSSTSTSKTHSGVQLNGTLNKKPVITGRSCFLCDKNPIFNNFTDFSNHLRTYHSSTEKGSRICRYGLNGVCRLFPINGINDQDYDVHVRKCHLRRIEEEIIAAEKLESANNDRTDETIVERDNGASRSVSTVSMDRASSSQQPFNIFSFTQNLSSLLSDPTRSRNETASFFIRHWGDQFVPSSNFPLPSTLPKITVENFRQYLTTTGKKHRQYLKVRRALRRALARHLEQNGKDQLPQIFFDPLFALHEPSFFNAVFLEPLPGEVDELISPVEKKLEEQKALADRASAEPNLSRPESSASLTSTFSLQAQMPADAMNGRQFRSYHILHNRLENYHDTLGALLNNELESKGEQFWKIVNSYGELHEEVTDCLDDIKDVRKDLKCAHENIYGKTKRVIEIHQERENKLRLIQRLQDIACLRDAQATVQMLLNQNDFPKALECIETAQDVLSSDLKGVVCFKHLSTQLEELHKVIGKMLQEEFVSLIQKEFGKPLEKESEIGYQEGQLHPVIHGLLRCGEYKFLQVLRHEIVEAVKNTIRQIIKNRIVEYGAELDGYDPSLGNLGDQMRRLNFSQWVETLNSVFSSLILFCRRIISIQELILENIDRVIVFERQKNPAIEIDDENNQPKNAHLIGSHSTADFQTTNNLVANGDLHRSISDATLTRKDSMVSGSFASEEVTNGSDYPQASFGSSAATLLSIPPRDIQQVRFVLPCLLEHAVYASQERVGRLLTAKSKGGFLEECSPSMFKEIDNSVQRFVNDCSELLAEQFSTGLFGHQESNLQLLDEKKRSTSPATTSTVNRSPLLLIMQQQVGKLITRFHESRKQKLATVLDMEQWRPADVPAIFQQMIDDFYEFDRLSDPVDSLNKSNQEVEETTESSSSSSASSECLIVDGEPFYVVGTALLLLRIMAQYCDLVRMFPDSSPEILQNVIEVSKNFNSRTCQLILGAGALQLVGLKTISVKNLALAARCLQLILKFIPAVKTEFQEALPPEKSHLLRHFDSTSRDYQDHIDEIYSKLTSVLDFHLVSCLSSWQPVGESPTNSFQQLVKQIGKFYNGFSSVMPSKETTKIFLRVHSSFKSHLRNILESRNVTPHAVLSYSMARSDFDYYIENMKALPDCENFPNDTITDVIG